MVQDIITCTDEDCTIFSTKLVELEELIKRDERRRILTEKRTCQAAEGKAKIELARSSSQKILFDLLKKSNLPEEIKTFLVEKWQQYLIITFLRHGENSHEWLDASQLIQDMIWACQPMTDEKTRQRLGKIKNHLLQRITAGIREVAATDEECGNIVNPIKRLIDKLPTNDIPAELRALSSHQVQSLGRERSNKPWSEMSEQEREQSNHVAPSYDFIKKAESLPIDTWLSYEDDQENRTLRCKLADRIESSDKYIFVNRFGFQVLEKSKRCFAYDLQENRAKPFESGLLFDRALQHISKELQQSA